MKQSEISMNLIHYDKVLLKGDFILSDKYSWSYIKKNVLALLSFLMAVNWGQDFKGQKSASIHHENMTPGG